MVGAHDGNLKLLEKIMNVEISCFGNNITVKGDKKAIEQTKAAYDNAMTKLSTGNGNLVKRAEDLKKIGAKASKSLPQNLIDKQEE